MKISCFFLVMSASLLKFRFMSIFVWVLKTFAAKGPICIAPQNLLLKILEKVYFNATKNMNYDKY